KNQKHSLFGRVFITTAHIPNPFDRNTNLLQDTGYRTAMAGSYTVGSTYLIGPNMTQAFRFSVNRNATHFLNVKRGQLFNWCDIGVKIYCEPEITRLIQNTITGAFRLTSGFLTGMK